MVGGVNSPVRAFNAVGGCPLIMERSRGAKLIDVDGNVASEPLHRLANFGAESSAVVRWFAREQLAVDPGRAGRGSSGAPRPSQPCAFNPAALNTIPMARSMWWKR